jgi:hypothetical protein
MGGIGNVMFKLAASISLAIDNKVNYIFSNEFIRPLDMEVVTKGFPDYRVYYDNVLRNINFINKLPEKYLIYNEPFFNYSPILYIPGTNLLLEGYFQSEKYFLNNKEKIIEFYQPNKTIINKILDEMPEIQNCVSVHVRRGDYVVKSDYHNLLTMDYYKKAYEILGSEKTYLIFSDSLDEIKSMFDFIKNKKFLTFGENFLDLYAMSLCEHNVIANSTFSWWSAYLNKNIHKKVIVPKQWFGPKLPHNTNDLIPQSWTKI